MSKYLDKLKRFSKNNKLIYATSAWIRAINHIESIEKENKLLRDALNIIQHQSNIYTVGVIAEKALNKKENIK